MTRLIEIRLEKRGVSCLARLLDDEAPRTTDYVWRMLPLASPAWHAKYAMNEVYCFSEPPDGEPPGLENSTVMPIPGDLVCWHIPRNEQTRAFRLEKGIDDYAAVVDLAVFYGRNNLLFNPATGFVPGNVYGSIIENYEAFFAACHDVWRSGSVGERFSYRRVNPEGTDGSQS